MLDWQKHLIYIPEIGYNEFVSVIRVNTHNLNTSYSQLFNYNKEIFCSDEELLRITITEKDIDKLQDLTQKIINNGLHFKKIDVFIDNYQNVLSYNNCNINNINTRITEDFISNVIDQNVNNYILEISIVSEYIERFTTKMYNRTLKLKKIISNLK